MVSSPVGVEEYPKKGTQAARAPSSGLRGSFFTHACLRTRVRQGLDTGDDDGRKGIRAWEKEAHRVRPSSSTCQSGVGPNGDR